MAVPKRRTSKARRDKRRNNLWKLTAPTLVKCDRCGEYDEDTREIISKINPYGAINGATDEYLIARGRRSIVEYTTYSPAAMANGVIEGRQGEDAAAEATEAEAVEAAE